eukprot:2065471-Ditylum_brightwellii.AAC.1
MNNNKKETEKNGITSQCGTNRDTDENSRKESDLEDKPGEQRKDTIQSNIGNKQQDNNSLWGKKGNESMTRRNASENTPYAITERNAAATWKTLTVTPRVDREVKQRIVMDTESEVKKQMAIILTDELCE